ncbi:transcriptional repressor [Faecalibacterium sp. An192]|uniref:Fur family transcriptional regulator n=1 Tax=Faecalibacterium sp. An192 TaxID=1965581 RepID=UPI000B38FC01|nr:transcriptional repressor [Faecalibacterium sp. An192]OUP28122.1 transcriptional repressor [Faecalibacterium sp. An192]
MRYESKILEIISSSHAHMTAEQVFFTLKQEYPGVVLATVYNNLNSLCQQGKIRKISVEGCPDRYDRNTRHDHLVCRRCGSLADIHLADITAQLEQQTGFAIDGYDLKIQYLCPRCRAAQDSGQGRAESVQKSSDL